MRTFVITLLATFQFCSTFAIEANISLAGYRDGAQTYFELYTYVAGQSIAFTEADSFKQANVSVTLLVKQAEQIVLADKFNLVSPEGEEIADFVDLRRYAIPNGAYLVEVSLTDQNQADSTKVFQQQLLLNYNQNPIELSDIELIASTAPLTDTKHPFAKQNMILEPFPKQFYTYQAKKMLFYSEIYTENTLEPLQVKYFVATAENPELPLKLANKKRKARALVPMLLGLDIQDLPSGEYVLVMEVRDSVNELRAKKSINFGREYKNVLFNSDAFVRELDEEGLRYSLRALSPIIPDKKAAELNKIVKSDDLEAKRAFLYEVWLEKSPDYAAVSYQKYMEIVRAVDNTFKSGFRFGFETDRGYFYLKYGRPDGMINIQDDPVAPPYEIWSYNDFPATQQQNIRFLFYNPSLAAGDYVLLHSTAIGERNNPQWEIELYRKAPTERAGDDFFSATEMKPGFARRARQLMEDF
ncbi:MAG: GWxTD domain-containing protein [Bacteroidota bacterium]